MNRPELYHESTNTLLDAYNEDKLFYGRCDACAVGNVCMNASIKTGINNNAWGALFMTVDGEQIMFDSFHRFIYLMDRNIGQVDAPERLIAATGYTIEELAQIEFAFETARPEDAPYLTPDGPEDFRLMKEYKQEKHYQFLGLTAVLKVLEEIHEVNKEDSEKSQTRLETIAKTKFEFA